MAQVEKVDWGGCMMVVIGIPLAPFFAARYLMRERQRGRPVARKVAIQMMLASLIPPLLLAGFIWASYGAHGDSSYPPSKDRRAYEALRARGFSDADARQLAPSIRELCESQGGEDCR